MRIGLDLDGVVYDWSAAARFLIEREFGIRIDLSPKRYTHWRYIENHLSPSQVIWLWTSGVSNGLFLLGSPIEGSIEFIRRVASADDEVVLITNRPMVAREDTVRWLRSNLGDLYNRLKLRFLLPGIPKSTVRPRCDIYLDDKPSNAADYALNTGAVSCLLVRSYNLRDIGGLPGSVCLVRSWHEFDRLVEVRRGIHD